MHFFPQTHDLLVCQKSCKDTFFPSFITFPCNFSKCNSTNCFIILGLTSIVIHCMNQHLIRNRPGSGSCDLFWLHTWKIMKGIHSGKPASLNGPIGHCSASLCLNSREPHVKMHHRHYQQEYKKLRNTVTAVSLPCMLHKMFCPSPFGVYLVIKKKRFKIK